MDRNNASQNDFMILINELTVLAGMADNSCIGRFCRSLLGSDLVVT